MSDEDDRRLQRKPALTADQLTSKISAYKILVSGWCLQRFAYHYVHGLWGAPSPAMAFGNAFDAVANVGYTEKLETGKDPTVGDSKDVFAETFEKESEDIEIWGKEDPGAMKDEGVSHAAFWARMTAPHVRPIVVQRAFSLQVQDWTVRGVIDVARERTDEHSPAQAGCFVNDHKTSGKSWTADKTKTQLQNVFYSLAAKSGQLGEGVDPNRIGYEIMVRLKGGPKRQRFVVGVGDRERAFALDMIQKHRKAWAALHKAGVWPTNRDHFMCSRRQCPHWQLCEKENGGTVKA